MAAHPSGAGLAAHATRRSTILERTFVCGFDEFSLAHPAVAGAASLAGDTTRPPLAARFRILGIRELRRAGERRPLGGRCRASASRPNWEGLFGRRLESYAQSEVPAPNRRSSELSRRVLAAAELGISPATQAFTPRICAPNALPRGRSRLRGPRRGWRRAKSA